MQREVGKYLFDIRESIASIEQYLGKKHDFDDYQANKLVRRAVERELGIFGEAFIISINQKGRIKKSNRARSRSFFCTPNQPASPSSRVLGTSAEQGWRTGG